MIIPPYLKKGDTIGITCPASKADPKLIEYGSNIIRSWGYRVKKGETTRTRSHNFSATDEQRINELQDMMDDDTIKAIIFGRGGYGVLRILDQLDFSHFKEHPKWICGYSDITALHLHIVHNYHIQTLHSLMCGGITPENKEDQYVSSLRDSLKGEPHYYTFPKNKLDREGIAEGRLIGGNLCLLAAICGSNSQPVMKDKILFIEDTGEYKYSIDRMMMTLKRAGWLQDLAGLIVGSFTNGKDTETPFGQTEWELIYDKVRTYKYPVAFGFPVGHQPENSALKEGAFYRFETGTPNILKEVKNECSPIEDPALS